MEESDKGYFEMKAFGNDASSRNADIPKTRQILSSIRENELVPAHRIPSIL